VTAASATMVSLVLLTGCAVGTRPFRYEAPPTVRGADREYCHALASTAAEKTDARYAAMMGIDPLGRTSGVMCELIDYPEVTLHDLRHVTAVEVLETGWRSGICRCPRRGDTAERAS
jgi:hypothetical protein